MQLLYKRKIEEGGTKLEVYKQLSNSQEEKEFLEMNPPFTHFVVYVFYQGKERLTEIKSPRPFTLGYSDNDGTIQTCLELLFDDWCDLRKIKPEQTLGEDYKKQSKKIFKMGWAEGVTLPRAWYPNKTEELFEALKDAGLDKLVKIMQDWYDN